jgi:hypothetical protein
VQTSSGDLNRIGEKKSDEPKMDTDEELVRDNFPV